MVSPAYLYSLCSSSRGNATFAGTREYGILIDAGLSQRQFFRQLSFNGIAPEAVKAIFITHEHSDHVQGLASIARGLNVPVYGSRETLAALVDKNLLPKSCPARALDSRSVEAAGILVKPFDTPHDSLHSLGYRLTFPSGKTACVCTDLGCITKVVSEHLMGSDLVLLESNYDETMLEEGPYPYFLKRRIFSSQGHLSNLDCADMLVRLFNGGTTKFLLGHLSEQNNRPELAYMTALERMSKTGAVLGEDYILAVARRWSVGEMMEV